MCIGSLKPATHSVHVLVYGFFGSLEPANLFQEMIIKRIKDLNILFILLIVYNTHLCCVDPLWVCAGRTIGCLGYGSFGLLIENVQFCPTSFL